MSYPAERPVAPAGRDHGYKAMGIGLEDLVAANLAYDRAVQDAIPTQSMRW
jgi:ornithine cyclodeaminase/alanine dehydrogenase-like protein (mu-crystallin family)